MQEMKQKIEMHNSKKEYAAPQMEVMDCKIQGRLLQESDPTVIPVEEGP